MEEDRAAKTFAMTNKQLGIGGLILVAVMTALGPIKDYVTARDEAILQNQRVERVEAMLNALEMKITEKMNRNTDKIMDRIREAEERTTKTADRLEHRIDSLEVAARFKLKNNN